MLRHYAGHGIHMFKVVIMSLIVVTVSLVRYPVVKLLIVTCARYLLDFSSCIDYLLFFTEVRQYNNWFFYITKQLM